MRPTESFGTEREVFAAAGFGAPQSIEVPHNFARVRTINEIVAAVYSLSYSAPHLFGDRKDEFEAELRELLASRSALGGLFAEQVGSVRLTFWRARRVGLRYRRPRGRLLLESLLPAKPLRRLNPMQPGLLRLGPLRLSLLRPSLRRLNPLG